MKEMWIKKEKTKVAEEEIKRIFFIVLLLLFFTNQMCVIHSAECVQRQNVTPEVSHSTSSSSSYSL